MKKQYLTYKQCSSFSKASNVKTKYEWDLLLKTFKDEIPLIVPRHPEQFYKSLEHRQYWIGYNQAKKEIKKHGFKYRKEYKANYDKLNLKKLGIPRAADAHYKNKGWVSWKHFLSSDVVTATEIAKSALSLDKLKVLVKKYGIKTQREYREWARSCNIKGVVINPHQTYKRSKEWKGYPNLFDYYKNIKNQYESYDIVKQRVHKLGIKSKREWDRLRKTDRVPDKIPKNPRDVYMNKGWTTWADWLGTTNTKYVKGVSPEGIKFWNYKRCQKEVQKLKIQNKDQFNDLHKKGLLPKQIPKWPEGTFTKEWIGYPKFFGTTRKSRPKNFKFWNYKKARAWARKSGIKGLRGWKQASKDNLVNHNIPICPHEYYKDKGWKGYNDFLNISNGKWRARNFEWKNFEEAKQIVQSMNFKNANEYKKWASKNNLKMRIPVNADKIYGRKKQ